jgi:hypothetical protein
VRRVLLAAVPSWAETRLRRKELGVKFKIGDMDALCKEVYKAHIAISGNYLI